MTLWYAETTDNQFVPVSIETRQLEIFREALARSIVEQVEPFVG